MLLYSGRSETSKMLVAPQSAAPQQSSWASLFANNSSTNSEQKKPVAKVSPYNSSQEPKQLNNSFQRTTSISTSNAPGMFILLKIHSLNFILNYQQIVFSIVLSYSSAASSTSNKRPAPAKARVAPSAKPVQNNLDSSVDESSLRLGGKLLINLICRI